MENIYLPRRVKIIKTVELSPTVRFFRLAPVVSTLKEKISGTSFEKNKDGLVFVPGQFVSVGQIGYEESPFGPLSSPYQDKYMDIAVRKTGTVTGYLHSLKDGDEITLRGPFGNGFPLDFLEGKDIVMATGGCGIPPIASFIEYIVENRRSFGNVYVLYGARNPEEILLKDLLVKWEKSGIQIVTTIDKPAPGWEGCVGFVPELINGIKINEANTAAVMCGPGPMTDAMERVFKPLGIPDRRIFVSMERKMQCGVGKCQHCTTGKKYACVDGPVFNMDEVDKNWD